MTRDKDDIAPVRWRRGSAVLAEAQAGLDRGGAGMRWGMYTEIESLAARAEPGVSNRT